MKQPYVPPSLTELTGDEAGKARAMFAKASRTPRQRALDIVTVIEVDDTDFCDRPIVTFDVCIDGVKIDNFTHQFGDDGAEALAEKLRAVFAREITGNTCVAIHPEQWVNAGVRNRPAGDDVSPETYVRMQEIADEMIARFGMQAAIAISLAIPMQVARSLLADHVGSETCAAVTDLENAADALLESGGPFIIACAGIDRHNKERPGEN